MFISDIRHGRFLESYDFLVIDNLFLYGNLYLVQGMQSVVVCMQQYVVQKAFISNVSPKVMFV